MFFLLGDSHTRSYKVPNYIATRIFLAQGRKNNFHNAFNFLLTTLRYLRAVWKLKPAKLEFAFIIGEPDLRKILYGEWNIGRTDEDILSSTQSLHADSIKLNQLCRKVKLFLIVTRFFKCQPSLIIGCGTPNPEMIDASLLFNHKLAKVCKDIGCLFFDPQSHAVSKAQKLLGKFLGYSVFNPSQRDHTHLSEEISMILNSFLQEVYMKRSEHAKDGWRSSTNFDSQFIEVKDFDTYKMKDIWFIALLKKCKHFFRELCYK